jgi:hypothetical protein
MNIKEKLNKIKIKLVKNYNYKLIKDLLIIRNEKNIILFQISNITILNGLNLVSKVRTLVILMKLYTSHSHLKLWNEVSYSSHTFLKTFYKHLYQRCVLF